MKDRFRRFRHSYMIMDTDSGNAVGFFETRDEAIAVLADVTLEDPTNDIALITTNRRGMTVSVELFEDVQDEG